MKRIVPAFIALACLLNSATTFAQTSPLVNPGVCNTVIDDFSTTTTNRGYTLNGFVYSGTQTSQKDLLVEKATSSTDYNIVTPAYYLTNGGTINVGFDLGTGPITGSNNYFKNGYTLFVTVEAHSGTATTLNASSLLASVTTTIDTVGKYCFGMASPNLTAGSMVRYRFFFTTSSGIPVNSSTYIRFDNLAVSNLQQAPLPVTIISFKATKGLTSNQLRWEVGTETNVDRYEVERSSNGRSYTKLNTIDAVQQSVYTDTDNSPLTGSNYYRIKAVDNNGTFKYSPVSSVSSKTKVALRAFPSPVVNTVEIQHEEAISGTLITVTSIDGRTVKSVVPTKGEQTTNIDLGSLQSGLYLIRFNNGAGEVETMKILKK